MSVCPELGFLDSSTLSGCDLRTVYAEAHHSCGLCWLLVRLLDQYWFQSHRAPGVGELSPGEGNLRRKRQALPLVGKVGSL